MARIRAHHRRTLSRGRANWRGHAEVGYQHDVDIPVQIVAKHPITAGLADFTIHDEIYWGFRVSAEVDAAAQHQHPQSGKPIAWCRSQGDSRVVYFQLGHGRSAFEDANYRQLVARCIRSAGRRDVRAAKLSAFRVRAAGLRDKCGVITSCAPLFPNRARSES